MAVQHKFDKLIPSDFTSSTIVIKEPKGNASQGKSCNLLFRGLHSSFQTCKMRTPFGLSKYDGPNNDDNGDSQNKAVKWSISLSFDDDEKTRDRLNNMKECLLALDESVLEHAVTENGSKWSGKNTKNGKLYSKETQESRCTGPSVFKFKPKAGKLDSSFPDTFRAKINDTNGKFGTIFFDGSKKMEIPDSTDPTKTITHPLRLNINFTDPSSPDYATKIIQPNCHCIISVYPSIWATDSNWGVRWVAQQVVVFQAVSVFDNSICHLEIDPSDQEYIDDDNNNNTNNDNNDNNGNNGSNGDVHASTASTASTSQPTASSSDLVNDPVEESN